MKLLRYQNKNKIYWKLFKTIKNVIYSWKSSKYYIAYELGASISHVNDPTLKNCLFGAVTYQIFISHYMIVFQKL